MALNLVGESIGYLDVIERAPSVKTSFGTRAMYKCKCICGNEVILSTSRLRSAKDDTTCGKCQDHVNHKDAYISWMAMKSRCDNPKDKDYPNYGGRGIEYCARWHKFKNFLFDMCDPPIDNDTGERLSLDRIDVNGHYQPNNCKWSTRSEQQSNKRLHVSPVTIAKHR